MEEAESNSSTVEDDEISCPIVFQCLKCNLIIGDSFAFHSSNPEMQTITLSAASNIKRIPQIFTSYSGHDIGCTYVNFTCSGCENPLGKFYLTTSSDIDGLREAFTFDGNSVSSYELGKPRHTRKRSESLLPENDKKFDIVMETSLQLQDALGDMQTEIQKLQHVIVGLNDRVGSLEVKSLVEEPDLSPFRVENSGINALNSSIGTNPKRRRSSAPATEQPL